LWRSGRAAGGYKHPGCQPTNQRLADPGTVTFTHTYPFSVAHAIAFADTHSGTVAHTHAAGTASGGRRGRL
jgi:hypothetical protein